MYTFAVHIPLFPLSACPQSLIHLHYGPSPVDGMSRESLTPAGNEQCLYKEQDIPPLPKSPPGAVSHVEVREAGPQ